MTVDYARAADRSQIFDKSQKFISPAMFLNLFGITIVMGLLSIAVSRRKKTTTNNITEDDSFLSRSQTDEWKGWMQSAVLIYHYSGTSKVLWIYILIRLMVASYLFMSGFGHTVYFYKTGDCSLRRVAGVLIRMNLLSWLLCQVMGTDYLFYYFAPLVSFWYLVVYLTLKVHSSRNRDMKFVLFKIVVSAACTTLFTKKKGLLECLFGLLQVLFNIKWDAREWRFRASLDIYIVYVGMIVGLAYARSLAIPDFPTLRRPTARSHDFSRPLLLLGIFFGLLFVPAMYQYVRLFPDKQTYTAYHPYISLLPVLAYVVIRNCHRSLRIRYSAVFAWLGRYSLETFILQYHIWLAADTKGLLQIGLFSRSGNLLGKWFEFVILTAVFLWASWGVAWASGIFTACILGDSPTQKMVKNSDESENQALEMSDGPSTHKRNLTTDLEEQGTLGSSSPQRRQQTTTELDNSAAMDLTCSGLTRCFHNFNPGLKKRLLVLVGFMVGLNWLLSRGSDSVS